jgi:3-methyladenine DNA glycosylase AlkC
MSEKFSLKDELFNPAKVAYLANLIKNVYPQFDDQTFVQNIVNELPNLELKERIFYIRENLEHYLPTHFNKAVEIILKSLPPELDPEKTDDDFGDFIFAPFSYFVAQNGLTDEHLELSFYALSEITKRFSAEDAVRFFINKYPNESFEFMLKMAQSENYHQRRLASEGLRPKLPWCIGLNFDYTKAIEILDLLYFDNTRFVVRSVANHLNDIAKIDADLVVQTLKKWQSQNQQNNKEFDFLVKHSLRTLIKQGNLDALSLLGFQAKPNISITNFKIKKSTIHLGEYLEFAFDIAGNNEKVLIDYIIMYSNNTQKVFKLKQLLVKNSENISKKHLFKTMTTKKLYSGTHTLKLQINGKIVMVTDFFLHINHN